MFNKYSYRFYIKPDSTVGTAEGKTIIISTKRNKVEPKQKNTHKVKQDTMVEHRLGKKKPQPKSHN